MILKNSSKQENLGLLVTYEWKTAVVTPVIKGGRLDRRLPTHYRPIALTSCIARVLEKLINMYLLDYLCGYKLLYEHQSGFLPRHSTITVWTPIRIPTSPLYIYCMNTNQDSYTATLQLLYEH